MTYKLTELEYWVIDDNKIKDESGIMVFDLSNESDQKDCLNVIKTLASNLTQVLYTESSTTVEQITQLLNTQKDKVCTYYDHIELR